MIDFTYWFMFPAAFLIVSFATAIGVGGPIFFTPIFILLFGYPTIEAFAASLQTQSTGYLSGSIQYARQKMVDFKLVKYLVVAAIPMVILGALIAPYIDGELLKALFGIGMIVSGYSIFRERQAAEEISTVQSAIILKGGSLGRIVAGIGGFLIGLISTGMGILLIPWMNIIHKLPIKRTIATTQVITWSAVAIGAIIYLFTTPVRLELIAFTIPGAILGGQVGPRIVKYANPQKLKGIMAVVFMLIGAYMILRFLGFLS